MDRTIATEKKLTEETKSNLADKQWVLRFTETKRMQTERTVLGYKTYEVNWTEIKKVAVLRLEFETDGKVYNLGSVSDMVSGDDLPGNAEKVDRKSLLEKIIEFFKNLWKKINGLSWWKLLLMGIALIFCVGIVVAIGFWGIKAVFKGIWWLFCLPFRGLKKLFSKKK